MTSVRVIGRLQDVTAAQWDALHDGRNPFVSHAFLAGMEAHGVLQAHSGWTPRHLTAWDGDTLVAAAPGYLKSNSHGEFVFDHAWANAYARYGRDYFPKWLCAVPYTPVTGPRLLARDDAGRAVLQAAAIALARQSGLSSAHVNFLDEAEDVGFGDAWLQRIDLQYHWHNAAGWEDFDAFLAAMDHKHRKNIRQERSRIARSGVSLRVVHGDEATAGELAAMHGFYLQTFAEYGNTPTLTLAFIEHLARAMPRQLVLFLAERDGTIIAGALCLRGSDTLYGRYWGASENVPGLHFETCYYQGIDYCLREGLAHFEPGAQGEHKLARGFLPAIMRSRHWIADPDFAGALRPWCAEEADAILRYKTMLELHTPFRTT